MSCANAAAIATGPCRASHGQGGGLAGPTRFRDGAQFAVLCRMRFFMVFAALSVPCVGHTQDAARIACGDASPCQVMAEHAAGRDVVGRRLEIFRVLLAPADHPNADGAPNRHNCAPIAYVLVATAADGQARRRTIVEFCNDGYGSSGVGTDSVTVEANRLVHHTYGGSWWRWSRTRSYQLSPFRLLSESNHHYHSGSPANSSSHLDHSAVAASGSWFSPVCGTTGEDFPIGGSDADYRWDAIPRLGYSDAALSQMRQRGRLGRCAAEARHSHGAPNAEPWSGTLRAEWPLGGPLLIEVQLPRRHPEAAIEVWTRGQQRRGGVCREQSAVRPAVVQRIQLEHNAAANTRVRRTRAGYFLEVDVPEGTDGLSVAYRGGGVQRATATIVAADDASVGSLVAFPEATCP